ncbi:ectoine/hydroxyectoine ABC transporter permease subunit EhuD [Arhodomonas sp. AD133]|uniref:ectoine/hydroxyectoine ABC transporter permease subunit EhuD n=1 Tax=Arhodomonas sp. AD133 TaxID=3415009 RepID=UPI003EBA423C
MTIWDWEFAFAIIPRLLEAAVITVEATVIGYLFALVVGLLLALMRRSHARWLSWPATAVVEGIRSTPLLVQIYFVFFVFPEFGVVLPAMIAGVLALGLHFSTYCSEVYRAGIDGVPRGQWEAAQSLNLSTYRTYRDIIIPQAIPPVVPALGNYLIGMIKETPLLSAIAVVEIMQEGKIIGSETFRYIEPMTLVGAFFLLVSLVSMVLIRRVESWLRRKIIG